MEIFTCDLGKSFNAVLKWNRKDSEYSSSNLQDICRKRINLCEMLLFDSKGCWQVVLRRDWLRFFSLDKWIFLKFQKKQSSYILLYSVIFLGKNSLKQTLNCCNVGSVSRVKLWDPGDISSQYLEMVTIISCYYTTAKRTTKRLQNVNAKIIPYS